MKHPKLLTKPLDFKLQGDTKHPETVCKHPGNIGLKEEKEEEEPAHRFTIPQKQFHPTHRRPPLTPWPSTTTAPSLLPGVVVFGAEASTKEAPASIEPREDGFLSSFRSNVALALSPLALPPLGEHIPRKSLHFLRPRWGSSRLRHPAAPELGRLSARSSPTARNTVFPRLRSSFRFSPGLFASHNQRWSISFV